MKDQFSPALLAGVSRLMAKHGFFADLLYGVCTLVEVESHPSGAPAATDGKTIWFTTKFAEEIKADGVVFVLAHEIAHAIWMDMVVAKQYHRGMGPDGKPFDPDKANRAMDYRINDALVKDNIGTMPTGKHAGLRDARYTCDMTWQEIYCLLPDEKGGGGGKGGFDSHEDAESGKTPEQVQGEVMVAVRKAMSTAKACGQLPGTIGGLLGEILDPKVPWPEVIRREIVCHGGKDENTWSRPNRRRMATSNIIWAGKHSRNTGPVVCVIDTSGSIGMDEIAQFLGEVKSIAQELHPERLHLLWTDTRVAKWDEMGDENEIDGIIARCKKEGIPGGGGTDMPAAFEYMKKHGIEAGTVVVFTDGETPFGEKTRWNTIWAITTKSISAPWGITTHINM